MISTHAGQVHISLPKLGKFRTVGKWLVRLAVVAGLAWLTYDYVVMRFENRLMWRYLTQVLAQTDDKRPVDRSGVLNALIREYGERHKNDKNQPLVIPSEK